MPELKDDLFKNISDKGLVAKLKPYEHLLSNHETAAAIRGFCMSSGEGANDGMVHLRVYGMILLNMCDKLDTLIEIMGGGPKLEKIQQEVVVKLDNALSVASSVASKEKDAPKELTIAELVIDFLTLCPATMDMLQKALSDKKSKDSVKLKVYDLLKKKKIEKVKMPGDKEPKFRIVPLNREMEKAVKSLTE